MNERAPLGVLFYHRRKCDPVSGCGEVYSMNRTACPRCGTPEFFSEPESATMRDYVYDIETYPNIFSATFYHVATGQTWVFEISERRNDASAFFWFIKQVQQVGGRGVGFNNLNFDYPVIHWLLTHGAPEQVTPRAIYDRAMTIINNQDEEGAFSSMVFENDQLFAQVDLFRIHHFDNAARRTSLKVLQFNMDAESVEDLPFPVGTVLTFAQMDELLKYNLHDVMQTVEFYHRSADAIEFREQVSAKYNRNFINHNDTKIGKDFFIMRLEERSPGICYTRNQQNRRVARQTLRPQIALADAVLPYIKFERPEFQQVLHYIRSQVVTETKGVFKNLSATINNFKYVFGLGGIHGGIDSAIVESDEHYQVEDADVTSYYPSLAIVNRFSPAHIGDAFADVYGELKVQRGSYKKGTTENATLKLALNGTFGDTGNKYSPLFDPLVLLSVTINGQLLLCMLAEQLIKIPGLTIVQVNTDGVTVRCPRVHLPHYRAVCEWWQSFTCLDLEFATYSRMFIRDVNNYIAEGVDGKVKRKGAYAYRSVADGVIGELEWHKNHSGRVIARAAEAALLDGENIADFVRTHPITRDFYMLAKVPRTSRLILRQPDGAETELQQTTRYYISKTGGQLVKIMPPDARKPGVFRNIGIDVGWQATVANRHGPLTGVNHAYYIAEAEKLVRPLQRAPQGRLF